MIPRNCMFDSAASKAQESEVATSSVLGLKVSEFAICMSLQTPHETNLCSTQT